MMDLSEVSAEVNAPEVSQSREGWDAVVAVRPGQRVRRLAERGLTTVEYAIGLVAAATAALVLLRIFSDQAFFKLLYDWVVDIFTNLAAQP